MIARPVVSNRGSYVVRLGAVALLALSAGSRAAGQLPRHQETPPWLSTSAAGDTVRMAFQITAASDAPSALINGYREGAIEIGVPLNAMVQWVWHSVDSTAPHSLIVMEEREKLPTEAGRPAFRNALTRRLRAGLPMGQEDRTTFTVDRQGWYWFLCGVQGHALRGEWIGLRVAPDAETASVRYRRR